jgi:NAD-dependent deacetylase
MQNKNLKNLILNSNNIVFFGGAGVSTESGIPDFRSTDGLYNQKYKYNPEVIISHSFFVSKTEEFYKFYRDRMIFLEAKPNKAHNFLAKLEDMGKLKALITQNIDGLHQSAGSKNVLELHGSIKRNYCMKCKGRSDIKAIINSESIPICFCGGTIKPDIVLYEEGLSEDILNKAIKYISDADVLIVGGTSLGVYPAAGLINYYRGSKLILINKSKTPFDNKANLIINDSIGKVFEELEINI